jgi:hypothetical protein
MPLQYPGALRRAPGRRAVGQRPGRLIWDEGNGGSSPSSSTRRPQQAQLPAERAPNQGTTAAIGGGSDPPPPPTHVPCAGNPKIRRRAGERPWPNWRGHLPTKQEVAGSSPAGRAVSEAEEVEAPGCGPGGSGFESRRTPRGSSPIGRGAWLRTRRFRVRLPGAAPRKPPRQLPVGHTWRRGGTKHERCHSAQRLI